MAKKNSSVKATSKKTVVKKQPTTKKEAAAKDVTVKGANLKPKTQSSVARRIRINWGNVKKTVKFILKWLLIAAIIFFFVGGTVISAWISDRDEKKKQEQQAEIQKQIEEYQKKTKEDAAKPKPIDPAFKVDGDITELKVIDEKTGDGAELKLGDKIKVKYKLGLASTGEVIEENTEGISFGLEEGALIKGWTEGLPGMKAGGIRRLEIPSDKGYGERGSGSIPANADLVFTVELIEINPAE